MSIWGRTSRSLRPRRRRPAGRRQSAPRRTTSSSHALAGARLWLPCGCSAASRQLQPGLRSSCAPAAVTAAHGAGFGCACHVMARHFRAISATGNGSHFRSAVWTAALLCTMLTVFWIRCAGRGVFDAPRRPRFRREPVERSDAVTQDAVTQEHMDVATRMVMDMGMTRTLAMHIGVAMHMHMASHTSHGRSGAHQCVRVAHIAQCTRSSTPGSTRGSSRCSTPGSTRGSIVLCAGTGILPGGRCQVGKGRGGRGRVGQGAVSFHIFCSCCAIYRCDRACGCWHAHWPPVAAGVT
mmetsp:Transcript_29666/g.87782  ORF Transcript_29666/g.87782 Transcript_29666/m.87782 type:complete len:295 (-) Transcript_29666:14-898(-)